MSDDNVKELSIGVGDMYRLIAASFERYMAASKPPPEDPRADERRLWLAIAGGYRTDPVKAIANANAVTDAFVTRFGKV